MAEEDQFSEIMPPLEVPEAVLYIEEEEIGTGLLSIGEEDLHWTTSNSDDQRISLKFPNIAIHAVSRDTSVFPFKPCVLLVYSTLDDSEEEVTRNYRILTKEPELLDEIYKMISDCQELYPDSELSSDSAEENTITASGEYFTTADGLQHLSLEGQSVLSHLESILENSQNHKSQDSAQFEDADA